MNLKKARTELGLSQRAVASAISTDQSQYSRVERGVNPHYKANKAVRSRAVKHFNSLKKSGVKPVAVKPPQTITVQPLEDHQHELIMLRVMGLEDRLMGIERLIRDMQRDMSVVASRKPLLRIPVIRINWSNLADFFVGAFAAVVAMLVGSIATLYFLI